MEYLRGLYLQMVAAVPHDLTSSASSASGDLHATSATTFSEMSGYVSGQATRVLSALHRATQTVSKPKIGNRDSRDIVSKDVNKNRRQR